MVKNENIKKVKYINDEIFNYISVRISVVIYLLMLFPTLYEIWKYDKSIGDIWYLVLGLNVLFIVMFYLFIYIEMKIRNKGKINIFMEEKEIEKNEDEAETEDEVNENDEYIVNELDTESEKS